MEQAGQSTRLLNFRQTAEFQMLITLAKENRQDLYRYVEFMLEEQPDGAKFIPKNFFTALLHEGIVHQMALFGSTIYIAREGHFVWKDGRLWLDSTTAKT